MKETAETLQEMLEAVQPKKWEEGDYTVPLAMEEFNMTKYQAQTILDQWVEEGLVEKFWGIGPNNKGCNIYRKA